MGGLTAAPGAVGRVAIVGVGLIGASLALALRAARPEVRLVAIDRDAALDRAGTLGLFERASDRLADAAGADLIVLAAPVVQNANLLRELPALLHDRTVVTDTGSTKRAMLEAARELPPHVSFVGGHPLAGAAQGGAEAARADLFRDRRWLLTPCAATRSPADVEMLEALVQACGAQPQVIDAAAHDRIVAAVSHLPQLTASSLMHVIGRTAGPEGLALAGPGLADTTRVAASPPGIWRDICTTNADAIAPVLDALIQTLERLRDDLGTGEVVTEVFTSARRWRSLID